MAGAAGDASAPVAASPAAASGAMLGAADNAGGTAGAVVAVPDEEVVQAVDHNRTRALEKKDQAPARRIMLPFSMPYRYRTLPPPPRAKGRIRSQPSRVKAHP